jgi:hypothetical protein
MSREKLLNVYIRLLFESTNLKQIPSANGITSGKSGFSKNQQTPNIAGGNVHAKLDDQRIQSPDDGYFYQYMQVDGPNQDQYTGETFATCKIDKKFHHLFPNKNMLNYKITAKGVNADAEVVNKIKQFYSSIKNKIDADINGQHDNLKKSTDNVYYLNKKNGESW